jgi:hypothetical protein
MKGAVPGHAPDHGRESGIGGAIGRRNLLPRETGSLEIGVSLQGHEGAGIWLDRVALDVSGERPPATERPPTTGRAPTARR